MKKALTLLLCICLLLGTCSMMAGAASEQTTAEQSSAQQSTQETDTSAQAVPTTAPVSASFQFINIAMGYASGTLFFEMPEQSNASSYALCWGDASGALLKDYTPLLQGSITGKANTVYTSEAPTIPGGAACMLLYTYSEQGAACTSPYKIPLEGYTPLKTGKLLGEYVVVADLHIGSGKIAEKNFTAMLRDVKMNAAGAAGIIVVGDAVEAAEEEYYLALKQLYEKEEGVPPLYLGAGDRCYLTKGTYTYDPAKHSDNLQLFLKYAGHPFGTKVDKPYYSYQLGDALMVFIGADSYENGNAVYSAEQLTWLTGVLDSADGFEPVLVFMHEPFPNTVSGTTSTQGYGNVKNHAELKETLKPYKNVVLFTAHTQYALQADRTLAYLSSGAPILNTAGIAHLWNDENGAGYEVAGSQGYYVTVYEDAVLIRGRDFTTGQWISNAVYTFSTKPIVTPSAPQPPKPSTTTKKPSVETETTEEDEEESGIRELIPPLCILAGMSAVVFIFIFRKPKEQE